MVLIAFKIHLISLLYFTHTWTDCFNRCENQKHPQRDAPGPRSLHPPNSKHRMHSHDTFIQGCSQKGILPISLLKFIKPCSSITKYTADEFSLIEIAYALHVMLESALINCHVTKRYRYRIKTQQFYITDKSEAAHTSLFTGAYNQNKSIDIRDYIREEWDIQDP